MADQEGNPNGNGKRVIIRLRLCELEPPTQQRQEQKQNGEHNGKQKLDTALTGKVKMKTPKRPKSKQPRSSTSRVPETSTVGRQNELQEDEREENDHHDHQPQHASLIETVRRSKKARLSTPRTHVPSTDSRQNENHGDEQKSNDHEHHIPSLMPTVKALQKATEFTQQTHSPLVHEVSSTEEKDGEVGEVEEVEGRVEDEKEVGDAGGAGKSLPPPPPVAEVETRTKLGPSLKLQLKLNAATATAAAVPQSNPLRCHDQTNQHLYHHQHHTNAPVQNQNPPNEANYHVLLHLHNRYPSSAKITNLLQQPRNEPGNNNDGDDFLHISHSAPLPDSPTFALDLMYARAGTRSDLLPFKLACLEAMNIRAKNEVPRRRNTAWDRLLEGVVHKAGEMRAARRYKGEHRRRIARWVKWWSRRWQSQGGGGSRLLLEEQGFLKGPTLEVRSH